MPRWNTFALPVHNSNLEDCFRLGRNYTLAVTETVRGSELLHLTTREYLPGDKNVKRNYLTYLSRGAKTPWYVSQPTRSPSSMPITRLRPDCRIGQVTRSALERPLGDCDCPTMKSPFTTLPYKKIHYAISQSLHSSRSVPQNSHPRIHPPSLRPQPAKRYQGSCESASGASDRRRARVVPVTGQP